MALKLRRFQLDALDILTSHLNKARALGGEAPRTLQFVAPCGSGKTVVLGHLIEAQGKDSVSIVTTPGHGGLARQTALALRAVIDPGRRVIEVRELSDLVGVKAGDVLVTSHEKLVKKYSEADKKGRGGMRKSVLARENTEKNTWWDMLKSVRDRGIEVLIFADESHYGSKTSASAVQVFARDIQEHLGYHPIRIEATATPIKDERSHRQFVYRIDRALVIKAGLNREECILNSRVKRTILPAGHDEDHLYLEAMYSTWCDARTSAHKLGLPTPLMLFCINNENAGGEKEREKVVAFLSQKTDPVTGENIVGDKVAIRLDGIRVNVQEDLKARDHIASASSPVVALIFKQSIAIGWDCPRAQFMYVMRSTRQEAFKTQLIGRLMRQPSGAATGDPLLDNAYVYSPIDNSFTIPDALTGMLTDRAVEMLADADQMNLFTAAELRCKTNKRMNQNGTLKPYKVVGVLKGLSITPTNEPGRAKGKVASDVKIANTMGVNESDFEESDASEQYAESQIGAEMIKKMRDSGVGPAARAWAVIRPSLQKWANEQEGVSEYPWKTMLANDVAMTPVYEALVELVKKETEDVGAYVDGEWGTYMPPGSRFVDIDAKSKFDVDAATHLYGSPTNHRRSAAEKAFEEEVLMDRDYLPFQLKSWFKNEGGVATGSDGRVSNTPFTLTYPTGRDATYPQVEGGVVVQKTEKEYANMQPDYITLVRHNRAILPLIFEVKGDGFFDGSGDNSRFAKAKSLSEYKENNARAAMVYRKGGVWMVVLGGTPSAIEEVPLQDWFNTLG